MSIPAESLQQSIIDEMLHLASDIDYDSGAAAAAAAANFATALHMPDTHQFLQEFARVGGRPVVPLFVQALKKKGCINDTRLSAQLRGNAAEGMRRLTTTNLIGFEPSTPAPPQAAATTPDATAMLPANPADATTETAAAVVAGDLAAAALEELGRLASLLQDICWEKLHLGHWKDVHVAWRDAYSLATLLVAFVALLPPCVSCTRGAASVGGSCAGVAPPANSRPSPPGTLAELAASPGAAVCHKRSPTSAPAPLARLDPQGVQWQTGLGWQGVLRQLDLAIMMGGPRFRRQLDCLVSVVELGVWQEQSAGPSAAGDVAVLGAEKQWAAVQAASEAGAGALMAAGVPVASAAGAQTVPVAARSTAMPLLQGHTDGATKTSSGPATLLPRQFGALPAPAATWQSDVSAGIAPSAKRRKLSLPPPVLAQWAHFLPEGNQAGCYELGAVDACAPPAGPVLGQGNPQTLLLTQQRKEHVQLPRQITSTAPDIGESAAELEQVCEDTHNTGLPNTDFKTWWCWRASGCIPLPPGSLGVDVRPELCSSSSCCAANCGGGVVSIGCSRSADGSCPSCSPNACGVKAGSSDAHGSHPTCCLHSSICSGFGQGTTSQRPPLEFRPSLERFLLEYMTFEGSGRPVIITGAMSDWPALERWQDLSYIRRVAGLRTVPVEVGSNYLAHGWGQQLMTLADFIDHHLLHQQQPSFNPCTSPRPDTCGSGATGRCAAGVDGPAALTTAAEVMHHAGEVADARPLGYLAQHPLFEQIPALAADIRTPDYCCLGEGELQGTNAWFGPAGTVTPLHHDPHHNLLAQVTGCKYVRLYAPGYSSVLHPHQNDTMQSNTSQVDLDMAGGSAQLEAAYPGFTAAPFMDCILQAGQTLYIPPGWWHYVKALTLSFSVSYWWR